MFQSIHINKLDELKIKITDTGDICIHTKDSCIYIEKDVFQNNMNDSETLRMYLNNLRNEVEIESVNTDKVQDCILCGKKTTGSVGQAGIKWSCICQKCKDKEDGILNKKLDSFKKKLSIWELFEEKEGDKNV